MAGACQRPRSDRNTRWAPKDAPRARIATKLTAVFTTVFTTVFTAVFTTRIIDTLLVVAMVLVVACGQDRTAKSDLVTALSITAVSPSDILPGTEVTIHAEGVLALGVADYRYRLQDPDGAILDEGPVARIDEDSLSFVPSRNFVDAMLGQDRRVALFLTRRILADDSASEAAIGLLWDVATNLDPALQTTEAMNVHLFDPIPFLGSGFLQAGEGMTVAILNGDYSYQTLPGIRSLHHLAVPLDVINRGEAHMALTVDLFGIRPGRFEGTVMIENHSDAGVRAGASAPLLITVERSLIDAVEPEVVRRGQVMHVRGAGFVPTDYALEATTLVALEGAFHPTRGEEQDFTGAARLMLVPDDFPAPGEMTWVLRVEQDAYGEMSGIGSVPGVFIGQAFPILVDGLDWVEGDAAEIRLEVARQLQVVLIKYLPGFRESLADFGLADAESQVRAAILRRCNDDYAGINISFVETRPQDLVDYSVIEVGGLDPNRAGLLGLDNTEGKDVGNLRFNDVIGGINAGTEEAGYHAYGGVFLDSFLHFSPSFPGKDPSDLASQWFDDIFSPFAPELGGEPATEAEIEGQGDRVATLDEAVRVLGNLVGNTVTHEIGHSLGLADIDGHYHNLGDNPSWLMDGGAYRSFEERSGLGPNGPEIFSPHNRAYLERVLPVD
jgi:hypothetical protein